MLYKDNNELIRLAEIDASNSDLLKEKTDGLSVIWSLDELKLMLTEEFLFPANSILFLKPQSRSLKSNYCPLDSL
jgi:hypothetical protein